MPMSSYMRWLAAAVLFLGPTVSSWADDPEDVEVIIAPVRAVRDGEGLFSADAKAKANAVIAELRTRHGTDLVVETRKAPALPKSVDAKDATAVNKFYLGWLAGEAKASM